MSKLKLKYISKADESAIVQRVRKVIKQELNVHPDRLTRNARFIEDLGADSLEIVALIMALEEEFGPSVADTDADNLNSVGDVINYFQKHQNDAAFELKQKEMESHYYSAFISYSHDDKVFAHLLLGRLRAKGISCWLDKHQLLPGDDIHERISQGIQLWDKVLLCASKSSLTSWWVDGEINRAFDKEAQIMRERGKKVLALIPLDLDGYLFGKDCQNGKKTEIRSRIAANFVGWKKDPMLFDRELGKIVQALRTDQAGREKPPASKL